jgi:hypothetical protein
MRNFHNPIRGNISMKALRTLATTLCALSMAASALPANAESQIPWNHVVLMAAPGDGRMTYVKEDPGTYARRRTATFVVNYVGPWTPAAKAAFQRGVNLWSTQINSTVPIRVTAQWLALPTGVLGSAGPGTFVRNFPGAPVANVWCPEVLANKRAGANLFPTIPEIEAQFSRVFSNWHFGATAAPPGRFDFTSVVMHEIGHGLGFIGAGSVDGLGRGTVRFSGFPTIYDMFTRNRLNQALFNFPNNSILLGRQLKSNNVWFRFGAAPAQRFRLYAPFVFDAGSSYSHLNEASYPAGNANSLMTPQIAPGETIRNPGAVTRIIFRTMGW